MLAPCIYTRHGMCYDLVYILGRYPCACQGMRPVHVAVVVGGIQMCARLGVSAPMLVMIFMLGLIRDSNSPWLLAPSHARFDHLECVHACVRAR